METQTEVNEMGRNSGGGGRGGGGNGTGFTETVNPRSGRSEFTYNTNPVGISAIGMPSVATAETKVIQTRNGDYKVTQSPTATEKTFSTKKEALDYARSIGSSFQESADAGKSKFANYVSVDRFFSGGKRMNSNRAGKDVYGRSFEAGTPIIYNRGLVLIQE